MTHRLLPALLAAAALTAVTARAQSDDDEDQEYDYFAYFTRSHNNLTFGFRVTEGAKVKFGNLGSIPSAATLPDLTSGPLVTRTYNNGAIGADAQRTPETDGSSVQKAGDPSRYQVYGKALDATGTPVFGPDGSQVTYLTSEGVYYQADYSRSYGFNVASQYSNGTITFNEYSVATQGAGFNGKQSPSGGLELTAEHLFTDPSKRFRFSLVAGVALNGINSKRSATVLGTLKNVSDVYSLQGLAALPTSAVFPFTAPDYQYPSVNDINGIPRVVVNGVEDSAPIYIGTADPTMAAKRTETDTVDGAEVTGIWEIKGSYLVLRLGPEVSASLTPNLSINASAGFAGAFVGTNYTAQESTVLADPTVLQNTISTSETSEAAKFLPGYYANVDASWAVNERTGFFAGVEYESLGDFTQTLNGRTAKIDLSGSGSVRGGLNIKF